MKFILLALAAIVTPADDDVVYRITVAGKGGPF